MAHDPKSKSTSCKSNIEAIWVFEETNASLAVAVVVRGRRGTSAACSSTARGRVDRSGGSRGSGSSDAAQDDNVLFTALEAIHGAHLWPNPFGEARLGKHRKNRASHAPDVTVVRGDDTDLQRSCLTVGQCDRCSVLLHEPLQQLPHKLALGTIRVRLVLGDGPVLPPVGDVVEDVWSEQRVPVKRHGHARQQQALPATQPAVVEPRADPRYHLRMHAVLLLEHHALQDRGADLPACCARGRRGR